MPELAEWETFCLIVGGAAGALIGLQFVVMTLIAERPPLRAADAGAAFATPTIVHLGAALLLSLLLSAPWHAVVPLATVWGLAGFCGFVYALIVARRMRTQTTYKPEFEDWLFHTALPLVAYAALAFSAFTARSHTHDAVFTVGTAAVLLLFIGIHNAWDAVAYHVLVNRPNRKAKRR